MIQKTIIKELQILTLLNDIAIEIPPQPELGDYAFVCFPLAKIWKKSPNSIAADLAEKFPSLKELEKVVAIGPYVNFFLNKALFARHVLTIISKEKNRYGKGKNKETIVIESPSPNTNKPLHLGHVRNIVLGQALTNILRHMGHSVQQLNLVNDRGVHICKSMLAYQMYGNNKKPDKKSDHFVGDYYVLFAEKVKEDASLEEDAQRMLQAWENKDTSTIELWKKMNKWALDGMNVTYQRLGLKHKKTYFESDLYLHGKKIIETGLKKNIFEKEDGAIIANLENQKLPNKVLIRSDGTSIYMTQDIYLAQLKVKEFKADRSIYIVGSEQALHFKQLFAVLGLLEYKWASKCHHLSYGMVNLTTGKMKSREGTVVDADNLLDEVEKMAEGEINKRHTLDKKEVTQRSTIIGLGALRFYLLKIDVVKDMLYNPKESVDFEGETGPYVQYAHARVCSILRKATLPKTADYSLLTKPDEHYLVRMLAQFPAVIKEAAKHYKPSLLCRYVLDLAQLVNTYYHDVPVLKAGTKTRDARILLLNSVRQVLENGLGLLGIEAPKEM